jgi:hypothetical protein
MSDLREARDPKREPQIDTVGWLFLGFAVANHSRRCDGRLHIDVYFENVGGAVFEAVFPLLNPLYMEISPHTGMRANRQLAVTRPDPPAALDASDLDQTVNVSRFHRK